MEFYIRILNVMVKIGTLISLFWTLLWSFYYLPPGRALDCKGLQTKYIIYSCCTSPKFNIDIFKDVCGKYMPEGIPKVSACLHECIYNASNILNDNQVNLVNVRKTAQLTLGSDSAFTDVFVEAIGNCSGSINEMKKTIKRRPRPLAGMEVCSPLPMMISVCARRYVTTHCPESQWIPNTTCENARQCEMLG